MKKEEIPPEHIWLDDEALEEWFERLHEKWNRPAGMEEIEDPGEMAQNDLTRGLREKG